MRRFVLALLVPLSTVITPGATPAGADLRGITAHHGPVNRAALMAHDVSAKATATLTHLAASIHMSADQLRAAWSRVAWCEVHGNWQMEGPTYSGIGFLYSTWNGYGGLAYAPTAGAATEDEQIVIGMNVTGGYIPDQYGCNPNGW
jgi:resuscitation-promoting factor RpfA